MLFVCFTYIIYYKADTSNNMYIYQTLSVYTHAQIQEVILEYSKNKTIHLINAYHPKLFDGIYRQRNQTMTVVNGRNLYQ